MLVCFPDTNVNSVPPGIGPGHPSESSDTIIAQQFLTQSGQVVFFTVLT